MLKIVKFLRSLIPFESLTITTSLTFSEVLQRLDEVVTPPKLFRITLPFGPPPAKPYEGTISGNTFKINRIITGRNSFLPIIKGEIYSQPFGCSIKIKMSLHNIVIAFMILWLWTTGSIGMFALFAWFVEPSVGPIFVPILGMFLFGWLLCLIPFRIEAKSAIRFISILLT
ncbi:MAG: hypothetical protein JGK17_20855 [Microcoleus sp. PH2017_10_PVI_O_A]|uniref:hypothetical protein n=1 Tax=unclassified Microcoleus TaxID=2642155 RepID=UPI001DAB5358|nr:MULTISPECIES: hypothetical protein [unclassified Microcoleus]TAE79693.1 MAG: hypothetical protein EAZ83_20570 [Oscillatoriales cyanobacterium]MCC3407991.1 hypothetical protein [Microcoleus sp. PH2017_10_PVI_O_A]MCC3460136.1 hypothetical protein [Microcoleus sp. PH2017_11_PCY_U_A]MCC3480133.1 hypothetical protein [Microcoleus sp. PH2017_12_PCY_D_A]MCC3527980.1 hypothetical protein [Microcoleus sp. PH2017_21_RUC_O_A]